MEILKIDNWNFIGQYTYQIWLMNLIKMAIGLPKSLHPETPCMT